MNMKGWGLSFLRARAKMILIGSLLVCGGLPVFATTVADNIKALGAHDPAVRRQAVEDLVKAGPDALPELLAAATNRRLLAISTIVGRMGRPAVPKLIKLLKAPKLYAAAGTMLAQVINPDSRAQIPALLSCLKDPVLKHYCGQALLRTVDQGAKGRVRDIAEALKSRDKDVRIYASTALGQMGATAAEAAPALEETAKDADPRVQQAAAEALKKIRA